MDVYEDKGRAGEPTIRRHHAKGLSFSTAILLVLALAFVIAPPCLGGKSKLERRVEMVLTNINYKPIPLHLDYDGWFSIEGALNNGRKPILLVDSGWAFTTLDIEVAKGLSTLGDSHAVLDDPLLGRLTSSSIRLVEQLRLGRMQFSNQPAMVQPLTAQNGAFGYEGALGWDFLRRNHCLMDCGTGVLYVRTGPPTAEQTTKLDSFLQEEGFAPAKMKPTRLLAVEVKLNGSKLNLLVDTGAAASVLNHSVAQRLHLSKAGRLPIRIGDMAFWVKKMHVVGVGEIGAHESWCTRPSTLEIGTRQWKKPAFEVVDLKAWGVDAQVGTETDVHGFLGNDLLVTNRTLIDFSSCQLWFPPGKGKPVKPLTLENSSR